MKGKGSRVGALVTRDDQRWGYLCAMVREAQHNAGIYQPPFSAIYDQGWQDALFSLVKVMFPWSDGAEHAEILNEAIREVESERA